MLRIRSPAACRSTPADPPATVKGDQAMPVDLPTPQWPAALMKQGPPEDPTILLGGAAIVGQAPHRVLAMRINPRTLAVDYRPDVDQDVYADYQLEEMAARLYRVR